jgi:hypothetical protein
MTNSNRVFVGIALFLALGASVADIQAQEVVIGPRMYFGTLVEQDFIRSADESSPNRVEESWVTTRLLGGAAVYAGISFVSVELGYLTTLGTPQKVYDRDVYEDGSRDSSLSDGSRTDLTADISYMVLGADLEFPLFAPAFSVIGAAKYLLPVGYSSELTETTLDDLSDTAKEELTELLLEAGFSLNFMPRSGDHQISLRVTGVYNLQTEEAAYASRAESLGYEYDALDWGILVSFGFDL